MRKKFYSLQRYLLPFLFLLQYAAHAQNNDKPRQCGTEISYEQLVNSKDQEFARRYREIDQFTKNYIQHLREQRRAGASDYRSSPIIIPVVVHVVYNTPDQNISMAQIQSQIDVLNRDFRRTNADISSVPSAFNSSTADCLIEFRLAARDPNCMPTDGVTRTATSVTSFSVPNNETEGRSLAFNPVKSTTAGGHDAWPRDKYLNIWVCNLPGGLLGYSSFPGYPANVDGVVIDFQCFGTTGPLLSHFNLGRTATHEIGHWLNLFHIWGDDGGACTGSDQVDDTPNQAALSTGCPTFPLRDACTPAGNGVMFMNYMDYTDDACMFMFTVGQAERIDATLYVARSALLASDALIPASGVVGITPDIFMQDKPDDLGDEPNTTSSTMYESEDIWVRNQDDGLTNQEHQNPLYRPSNPNYVYVRVRNRGCNATTVSGTLKLYWAKASSALGWTSPWDGSVTSPALMGTSIGSGVPVSVLPGSFQIIRFPWYPPNPADYSSFGADQSHFCLLARIETSSTSPYGMTSAETGNLWANVQNNNNIVWKNVSVVNEVTGGRMALAVTVGNFGKKTIASKIYFKSQWTRLQQNFLQYGKAYVELSPDLYKKWRGGGSRATGLEEVDKNMFLVESSSAFLEGFEFKGGEFYTLRLTFEFTRKIPFGSIRRFDFNVEQTLIEKEQERLLGGETFIIKSLGSKREDVMSSSIKLQLKAWLQGAYQPAVGLMTDSLRAKTLLPATTPYPAMNFSPVNNFGDETVNEGLLERTGSEAITDWVWLELRDADTATKILSTRSALIRRDGSVVDMDGFSPVSFNGLAPGSYYVALRHRNHLGVMTATAVSLSANTPAAIDFTDPATPTYGTEALLNRNGITLLWAGDVNGDHRVRYNGSANDKNAVLSKVGLNTSSNTLTLYDRADINLDGTVRYNGAANDKNEVMKAVGLSTPNRVITEQIPNK